MNVRTPRIGAAMAAATLLSLCGMAHGTGHTASQINALKEIQSIFRGVSILEEQGHVKMIYGVPMGAGMTPRDSAQFWLSNYGEALGAGGTLLSESWNATFENNAQFTVFTYQQYIEGLPVEYGMAKVLVLNSPTNPVVYAAGNLAQAPANGFAPMAFTGDTATAMIRSAYPNMTRFEKPELVVFQGLGDWVEPVRAWKVSAQTADFSKPNRAAKTFFLDAATGQIVGVRDDIQSIDVSGTAQGKGTTNLLPDTATNLPGVLAMPEIKVGITGGNTAYTARDGTFTITNGGSSAVTVGTGVGTTSGFGGRWTNVVPTGGGALTNSVSVTPPGPANLMLNNAPAATATAQVNAFICTDRIHNYFRDRSGTFSGIDLVLPTNTAVAGTCNAFFTSANGGSINFYNAGGGCVNSAYSTVVAHEYGHFIANRLSLAQNAFGEGFGDTNAMLSYDTPVVAADFYGVGSPIRNPATANIQYPCSASCGGEIHCCGQLIAGIWWSIRGNMGTAYGSGDGLARTQQMQVSWSLITVGGPNSSTSAGPTTEVEVLTVDDTDGNLANGTPNISRICPAFSSHNISNANCSLVGPANNNCANAIAVGNGTTNFSNVNATTDGYAENGCNFCCNDPMINQDIWYTYTASCTGMANISLCGSSFDTKVAIYNGAGCPSGPNQAVACNDDSDCGSGPVLQSQVSWPVVSGQQYKIRIGGYLGAQGTGQFTLSCGPANDLCSNAITIGNGTTHFSNAGASTDGPEEPNCNFCCGDLQVNQDIWYRYTATCSGTVTVDMCSADYDSKVAIYAGSCPSAAGTAIACNDDANCGPNGRSSKVTFTATNGSTYLIRVGAFSTNAGSGDLVITCGNTCYANCDNSTTPPVLNVNDFICFQSAFAAGLPYANCDGSTTAPVLNVNDFICFQSAFAAGCQ